ncbi:MAG TPA: hypothetical protein VFS76_04595 [Pyrinomonadaceae bacterium]|nr:hypothetical protein [Pyrinomonadaceae bacterium]
MQPLISRSVTTERVFPPITPALYKPENDRSKLNPDQSMARTLVACPTPLTLSKHFRRRRNGRDFLTHALFTHRSAFESELAGEVQRADFFWEELYTELNFTDRQDVWSSLAQSLSNEQRQLETLSDPTELRSRFVDELLIDTHAAFFNGYVRNAAELDLNHRAWKHFYFVLQLLDWSGLGKDEKFQLIRAASEARLVLLETAERWQQVRDLCKLLLNYAPNPVVYEDRISNANLSQRINHHVKANNSGRTGVHNTLAAVRDLKQLIPAYPQDRSLYKRLAALHYDSAVQLNDIGEISYALLAAQQSVTTNPTNKEYAALLAQLTTTMNDIKERANGSPPPGPRYQGTGPYLRDLARSGFSLVEEYKASDEARVVFESARLAEALNLWRRIGLPKPSDRWPERACKLLDAVSSIFASRPANAREIAQSWQTWARGDRDLSEIQATEVCDFLRKKLVKRSPDERKPEVEAVFLEPASRSRKQKETALPFRTWLLSKRERRLKLQVAAAVVIFLVAGVVFLVDLRARSVRTASYQSILQGETNGNYLQVIDGAEAFLSHPLVMLADDRDAEVVKRYSEALVMWVARQPGEGTPEITTRVERYQQLVANGSGGGL